MAVVDGVVDPVGFTLDHANTIVELLFNTIDLIGSSIVLIIEGRIVSADLGDVAVRSAAKLGVAIARLCVGRGCRAAGASGGSGCGGCVEVRRECHGAVDDAFCDNASTTN